ncbi:hypothetical protein [Kitasatospora sp. NPDC008115]|uniref:hypothetical protein n=1 Tax=Kitasatospora sp. NPDC008115 TaxID=3364022 RepID=UPI0036E8CCEF
MDRRSPLASARRYGRLPALALAALALAACSSSGGGSTTAATTPAAPAATAPATTTPATTPAPAPTPTATAPAPTITTPAPTATTGSTPTVAGKRPADACTLLTSPQVVAAVGTGGPFRGTHHDPKDGKPVWGCTWGSRQSYASIEEIEPSRYAALKASPDLTAAPMPGIGREAQLIRRKDGSFPAVYFVADDGHVYEVEVVKDRGPGDDAEAEALAASTLALVLSKGV